MRLYHRTHHAHSILQGGFKDGEGFYLTNEIHRGVWLSDRPLDINEGAKGDMLLIIDIPEDVIADHEWIEEGKPYREFLIPAEVVNRYGPPRVAEDEYQ